MKVKEKISLLFKLIELKDSKEFKTNYLASLKQRKQELIEDRLDYSSLLEPIEKCIDELETINNEYYDIHNLIKQDEQDRKED